MPSSSNQTTFYAEQDYSQISALKKIGQDQSRITYQPLRGAARHTDSTQPLPQKSDQQIYSYSNFQETSNDGTFGLDQIGEENIDLGGIAALRNIPGMSDDSRHLIGTNT